ncbi:alpha/beta fold hydrolase [Halobacillus sp. A5]|uniref:alpha/beta fold hydrolase n=1 Tax=Halobacillus sp. A5 TaxID=2880263 RepID=UPI0020A65B8C|nr:alpha/beta fold hydrolase [Halobacillus sp. A5]MCP3029300.1 alpha/beta hydrolase [Halobacillus sp. A5]
MLDKLYTNKKKFITIMILSFVLGGSLFFINSTPTRSEKPTEMTPTIFVHGFKGGPASFNTMLDRFEDNKWGNKRMVVYVSPTGDVRVRGGIPHTMNPFIQVIFGNNRASVADQTNWMQSIMSRLKQDYAIDQVNLVGHSMGGLASTNFLLNNQENDYPEVNKLVTIGSPFLGIGQNDYFTMNSGEATVDLQIESNALTTMINSKENFDEDVQALSIAGIINEEAPIEERWDGLVTEQSAHGLNNIVPEENYYNETFIDANSTHSGLHEHTGVDQTVAEFLWSIH